MVARMLQRRLPEHGLLLLHLSRIEQSTRLSFALGTKEWPPYTLEARADGFM
jgi:hypothetical protein